MNKQQTREVANLETYIAHGMIDVVARSISAMIRSAMTKKSKQALIEWAQSKQVTNHPEFII